MMRRPCVAGVFAVLGLVSAANAADILETITRQQPGMTKRHSSGLFDPESNADAYHLAPGQRLTAAELDGPGQIRHIWFTVAGQDRRWPRSLVLRIFWDGAETPSVETPIGDFFAAGNGMRANVSSVPIEVTSYGRALNSYWHMPFRKKARVELWNQSRGRMTVYCQINWLQLPALAPDTLYFHARYHQEFPVKPFSPYTIFEGEGEGQYVGTVLSSQNSLGSWFGESDDRYFIDGEKEPSLVGTGTEDFFTDAWNLRQFTNQNAGVTICEPKGVDCRMTAYRWHLHAPVIFRRSLRVEIERRSFVDIEDPATGRLKTYDFKFRPDLFSSVAFWYQKQIARPFCPLPPAEDRVNPETWIEVKEMVDRIACSSGIKPLVTSNRTCQGKKMFYVANDRVGAWLEVPLEIEVEGQYSLSIFQVLFREYGTWKVTIAGGGQARESRTGDESRPNGERPENGTNPTRRSAVPAVHKVLDPALDFYDACVCLKENSPENQIYGTVRESKLGVLRLVPGQYSLRLECVGANPLARVKQTGKPGYSLAIDAISLRRLPWDRMDRWWNAYQAEESRLNAEKLRDARETVRGLSEAVARFARDTGAPPQGLDELVHKPSRPGLPAGHWPYLAELPADPWGQDYRYRCPGLFHPWAFDVYSVHGDSRAPASWIGNWDLPFRFPDAIEGESLRATGRKGQIRTTVQEIAASSVPPLSGGKQLFLQFGGAGDRIAFVLPAALKPGRYRIATSTLSSWDYGIAAWSLDGQPLGRAVDGYSPTTWRQVTAGTPVTLTDRPHELSVEIVGRHPQSTGYAAGLDAIMLRPED